jgi:hypothetical protein
MPSGAGNSQNMYNQLSNAGQNPYYDQLSGTYQANADRALNSALNTVDLRTGANGMAGSSRAGIASGMAMRDVNTDLQSNLANLAYQGYNQNMQNRMALAQSADQTAMQKYGADLGYAGTVYGADRGLEGTKYASDNSLKGSMYGADKGLEGTMYSSDAAKAASMYGADKSYSASIYGSDAAKAASMYGADKGLQGTMYSSDAAKAASMYGADKNYAANIYGTDMQGYLGQLNNATQMYGMDQNYSANMGNVANNAAQIQNMYNLGMAQNNTANNSLITQLLGGMQGSMNGGMQAAGNVFNMGNYGLNNSMAPLQGLQYYAGALGQPTILGSGGSFGSGVSNAIANSMGMNMSGYGGIGANSIGGGGGGGGLCFITTAATSALGEPDDGPTLTKLRLFRDEFMLNDPALVKEVSRYYDIAPEIVRKINQREDSDFIYESINNLYLQPAVEAIDDGDNEKAYEIYKDMVNHCLELVGE